MSQGLPERVFGEDATEVVVNSDDKNAMVAAAMTLKLNVSKPPSGQIVRVDELDPLLTYNTGN